METSSGCQKETECSLYKKCKQTICTQLIDSIKCLRWIRASLSVRLPARTQLHQNSAGHLTPGWLQGYQCHYWGNRSEEQLGLGNNPKTGYGLHHFHNPRHLRKVPPHPNTSTCSPSQYELRRGLTVVQKITCNMESISNWATTTERSSEIHVIRGGYHSVIGSQTGAVSTRNSSFLPDEYSSKDSHLPAESREDPPDLQKVEQFSDAALLELLATVKLDWDQRLIPISHYFIRLGRYHWKSSYLQIEH